MDSSKNLENCVVLFFFVAAKMCFVETAVEKKIRQIEG